MGKSPSNVRGDSFGAMSLKFDNIFELATTLVNKFRKALIEYGAEERDHLIADAKKLYDKVADSTDIPLAGPETEKRLEQEFWTNHLEPTLNAVADRLVGPKKAK